MNDYKMREEFEAWWRREYENTLYCESAWRGWQASRAAPAVQGEPVAFNEDAALSLAERAFYTEVDEQLADDIRGEKL